MTLPSNVRLAGTAYVLYIATGIGSMVAPAEIRPVLGIVMAFCALALGVTLYAITRHVDRDSGALRHALPRARSRVWQRRNRLRGRQHDLLLFAAEGPDDSAWLSLLGLFSSGGLVVQVLVQLAAGTSTNWSLPMIWVIWFPLLIFELTFAAVLLANRLTPTAITGMNDLCYSPNVMRPRART